MFVCMYVNRLRKCFNRRVAEVIFMNEFDSNNPILVIFALGHELHFLLFLDFAQHVVDMVCFECVSEKGRRMYFLQTL